MKVHEKPEELILLRFVELHKSSFLLVFAHRTVQLYILPKTFLNVYKPLVISIVTYGSKALVLFLFLVMRKTPTKHTADLFKEEKK